VKTLLGTRSIKSLAALAVIACSLVAAGTAQAAPTLTMSQSNRVVKADWTTDPGWYPIAIDYNTAGTVDFDGLLDPWSPLTEPEKFDTTFTSPSQFPPGTYYFQLLVSTNWESPDFGAFDFTDPVPGGN